MICCTVILVDKQQHLKRDIYAQSELSSINTTLQQPRKMLRVLNALTLHALGPRS